MMTKFLKGITLLWNNKRVSLRVIAALLFCAAFTEAYLLVTQFLEETTGIPYLSLTLNALMIGVFLTNIKSLSRLVWTFAWR